MLVSLGKRDCFFMGEVDKMKVTKLSKDRYEEAIRMSMYAFQYHLTDEEIERNMKRMEENKLLGIVEEEKLAAKLYIIPFQVFHQNQIMNMGGIAGVATYPEYRRKGFVKELMIASLKEMRADGQLLSMLSPFYIDFYRKFGWEIFSEYEQIKFQKEELHFIREDQKGNVLRLTSGQFHEDLQIIYEKYAQKHSGMLVRTKKRWEKTAIQDQSAAIYYSDEGKPLGYLLYKIEKRNMNVEEFIVLSNDARIALWNYICQHDSMLDQVEMNVSLNESLTYLLKDPVVKREVKPYFMARIVDVKEYLKQYSFRKNIHDTVCIYINDEYAPWNTGTYCLSSSGSEKLSEKKLEEYSPLSLSVNSASALLLGYKEVKTLWDIGKITGSDSQMNILDRLIPKQIPYFLDHF